MSEHDRPANRPAPAAPAMVVCDSWYHEAGPHRTSIGCLNPRPAPAPASEKQLSGEEDDAQAWFNRHGSRYVGADVGMLRAFAANLRAALSAKEAEIAEMEGDLESASQAAAIRNNAIAAKDAELARVTADRDDARKYAIALQQIVEDMARGGPIREEAAKQSPHIAKLGAAALARVEVLEGLVKEAVELSVLPPSSEIANMAEFTRERTARIAAWNTDARAALKGES